ncbi:putative HTH-type transcriptional regulator YazB [Alicyclobacillus cellulosilyticus]|uniref:HTH-type transcriptional regulator YazB n=1 Tax=Alicyclobacillus cellulosilyticus TaxID=1003997 RepID=A0A917NLA5_9BACL|nr:helix-turn-helix transcriptional regulator [Alicyclobacillus cellulosilyticus]GGJ09081.1 putative HTH-type transcriptional regulator YazB [Alicyclobacillus cellulosilyticus]
MWDAFGRRLRAFRKMRCWTQQELAHAAGISLAVIGSLERGTRRPTPDLVKRLAAVLRVSESELCPPSLVSEAEARSSD